MSGSAQSKAVEVAQRYGTWLEALSVARSLFVYRIYETPGEGAMMLHTDLTLKRWFCSNYDVHIEKIKFQGCHKAGFDCLTHLANKSNSPSA
jgi:hypothetical protein